MLRRKGQYTHTLTYIYIKYSRRFKIMEELRDNVKFEVFTAVSYEECRLLGCYAMCLL
jgi:hypothetical protein